MTKLSYIHGIGSVPSNELADRARQVPAKKFINFSTLTAGELKLALALEQSDMLASFYPENKEFRQIGDALRNALYTGVHGPNGEKASNVANEYARRIISTARVQNRPAAKYITDRESLLHGPDDAIVPDSRSCGFRPGKILGFNNKKYKAWEACLDQIGYQIALNRELENSAHHILYNFEKNPNSAPNSVAAKKILHQTAIYKWAEITGLTYENLSLWVRNGVMRGNTKQGLAPMQPEESIDLMRYVIPEKNKTAAVNGIDPELVVQLGKLLVAIFSSIGATVTLLKSIKAKDQLRFQSSVGDMGLPPFGPQETDWMTDGQGQTAQQQGIFNTDLLIPVAGAAAAYLIFK